jgi:hypothetical protein
VAKRIVNRGKLREQAEQAETAAPGVPDVKAGPRGKKARVRAAPRVKKSRAKKVPPRLRARWGVFDGTMKQVAIFDYSQRAAADAKLADLLDRKKGIYFLQIVKEPMPEPAPAEPPVIA